jgi:glycosyltransferase involved in cell wall biosynthesis
MISILLATYNWPQALKLCLESLSTQIDLDFEIIIADDGSSAQTKNLIEAIQPRFPVKITHLWQEDQGFRKTRILNQAIEVAGGEYLIFLDGDCIVQPDFIAEHRKLAQADHLVTGSRVLLNESLTLELLTWAQWDFKKFANNLLSYRLSGGINKYWPLKIKLGNGAWRNYQKFVWRRIKGCNMACWKADALAIGGFDETMTGWGHEDADFVFRLQNRGLIRKSGSWSTEVLHLHHRINDQSNAAENARRVREKILAKARQNN